MKKIVSEINSVGKSFGGEKKFREHILGHKKFWFEKNLDCKKNVGLQKNVGGKNIL